MSDPTKGVGWKMVALWVLLISITALAFIGTFHLLGAIGEPYF